MLDIKFIRENPEKVKKACHEKQVKVDIDRLLEVDKKRRELLQALEDMRAQKNKANEEIKGAKSQKEKEVIILKMRELDSNSDRVTVDFQKIDEEFQNLMWQIPNIPLDDVLVGKDERDNVVLKEVGERPKFDFKLKDHLELSQELGLIDIERAAKVSGSRFYYLEREVVPLEFALIDLALKTLMKENFIPVIPPVMIRPQIMEAMGYIATKEDLAERYFLEKDNLFLIGTAEQSIGPIHKDEIFEERELPKRYVGFSTCFREEAGSYGKDTRGILRTHQFDKIEMFSFSNPKDSKREHDFFLNLEEKLMRELKLPYRVVKICSGDMAFPTARQYDIETWLPSENRHRETHSTSNCTDFQARRLNIRYRDKSGKLNFVHTINGTAFAIGRTLIAIIENYQQKDGSVKVPGVLQKYVGFKEIKRK